MKERELKIYYSPKELEVLKAKAKKVGKSITDYQKDISKKAKVKIIIK